MDSKDVCACSGFDSIFDLEVVELFMVVICQFGYVISRVKQISNRLFDEMVCSGVRESINGSTEISFTEQGLRLTDPRAIYTILISSSPLAPKILRAGLVAHHLRGL